MRRGAFFPDTTFPENTGGFVFKLFGVLVLIAAVSFVRIRLAEYTGDLFGFFIFFYAAVAIVAWFAGFWLGVIATITSTIAIVSSFAIEDLGESVVDPRNIFVILLFFIVSVVLSWLGEIRLEHVQLLEREEKQRDEFVKIASHEVRAPLTLLKLNIALLRASGSHDTTQLAVTLEEMDQQVAHMQHLVGDLLDVAKIQQGTFTYRDEPFPLEDAVRETVHAAEKIYDFKATIRGHIPSLMNGDREKIMQLCTNIVSNAAKYSPDDRHVDIDLRETADFVEIKIHDHGIGITSEQLHKVFDPFFRAQEARAGDRFSGLGLGLYVSKRIVDHYAGTIALTSEQGRGTEVVIKFPATCLVRDS